MYPCKDTLHTHTSCYAQESSFWKNRRRIISFFQFPRIRKHLSWETALQHKSLYLDIFVRIYYPSSSHALLVKLSIHHDTLRFIALCEYGIGITFTYYCICFLFSPTVLYRAASCMFWFILWCIKLFFLKKRFHIMSKFSLFLLIL